MGRPVAPAWAPEAAGNAIAEDAGTSMFQQSEITCLALAVPFIIALIAPIWRRKFPWLPALYGGVLLIVAAYVFTVVESVAFELMFNLLEHACYALAGVAFAVAAYRLPRCPRIADRSLRWKP